MKRNDATGQLIVIRQVLEQSCQLPEYSRSYCMLQASIMEALRRMGWKEETINGTN
jgi:ketopantoate hydroxymethyltransferase